MIPRSQAGDTTPSNLLEVPEAMHRAWHYLFMNMTPEQVIAFVAIHWAPVGFVDMLILRHNGTELRLTGDDIRGMVDAEIERTNIPSFRDADEKWVKKTYKRKRKRSKPSRLKRVA